MTGAVTAPVGRDELAAGRVTVVDALPPAYRAQQDRIEAGLPVGAGPGR